MPTADGAETLSEKLARIRAELVRARTVLERLETGGQSVGGMGHTVTLVGYEQAQRRVARLEAEESALAARLARVNPALPGWAVLKTVMS
jgi:50S ribosomal subunit-associated GTPase HflX